MRQILLASLLVCCTASFAFACGYNFVGGCSTDIDLTINGTTRTFSIADCAYEIPFHGRNLSTIRTISLSRVRGITWESCINNVTSMSLRYRITPVGQSGGSFSSLLIPEEYNTLEGPYTTRYRSVQPNINVTNGLTVGVTYRLEVYYFAEIDTIGDDFLPETTMLQNNNGQNYSLTFTYGGPNAPKLVAVTTKDIDVPCYGDTTGIAEITVFGSTDPNSLFYSWSEYTQNFFQLNHLPGGTYTVTATETSTGASTVAAIEIGEPDSLVAQIINSQDLACGVNQTGSATVQINGGTLPYHILWSNGDTLPQMHTNISGNYTVVISDANGCSTQQSVTISGNSTQSISGSVTLCKGETYQRGGQTFSTAGTYQLMLPGVAGCDTALSLLVKVLDPDAFFNTMPSDTVITCYNPMLTLCATDMPTGANYTWIRNDVFITTTNCFQVTMAGTYFGLLMLTDGNKTCTGNKSVKVTKHTTAAPIEASAEGIVQKICEVLQDTVAITFQANTSEPTPGTTFVWLNGNDTIATQSQFTQTFQYPLPFSTLEVHSLDLYGCTRIQSVVPDVDDLPTLPLELSINQATNCDGTIHLVVFGLEGTGLYSYMWGDTTTLLPYIDIEPGLVVFEATNQIGCKVLAYIVVEDFYLQATSTATSNLSQPNGTASVFAKGGFQAPVQVLWDNGAIGNTITNLLPGTYCATVTEAGGCIRDTCIVVDFVSGSTQPIVKSTSLFLSPNPANGGTTIQVTLTETDADWVMLSTDGIIVNKQGLLSGTNQLRLPDHLPSGLYTCMLLSSKYCRVGKIFLNSGR